MAFYYSGFKAQPFKRSTVASLGAAATSQGGVKAAGLNAAGLGASSGGGSFADPAGLGASSGGGGIVLPGGPLATLPAMRSSVPSGLPSVYAVQMKHGHLYAIGIEVPFPASLLPVSELASLGGDLTKEMGASLSCRKCGLFKADASPYKRAGGPAGATHIAIVEYTGQDRTVDTAHDPSGRLKWIDDVTSAILPETIIGEPAASSPWPWIVGGVILAGLAGVVYYSGDLV